MSIFSFITRKWSHWKLLEKKTSFVGVYFKETYEIYYKESSDGLRKYKKVMINPRHS